MAQPTREEQHRPTDDARTCPACNGTLEETGDVTEDAKEITVERPRRMPTVTLAWHVAQPTELDVPRESDGPSVA